MKKILPFLVLTLVGLRALGQVEFTTDMNTVDGVYVVCPGVQVNCTTTATGTLIWKVSPKGEDTELALGNGSSFQFTSATTGEYQISLTKISSNTITAIEYFDVLADIGSIGNISGPTELCAGNYDFTVPLVDNAVRYEWTLPNGSTGSSSTNSITIAVGNSYDGGVIEVSAHDDCGNSVSTTLNVTKESTPVAPTSITASLNNECYQEGKVLTLSAEGEEATEYEWFKDDVLIAGFITRNIEVNYPSQNTTYSVRAVNSCGEVSSKIHITITVADPVSAFTSVQVELVGGDVLDLDADNCYVDQNIKFTGAGSNADGILVKKVLEDESLELVGGGLTNQVITNMPTTTTSYWIIPYSQNCEDGDSTYVTININPLPQLPTTINGPADDVCPGVSVNLAIQGGQEGDQYLWSAIAGGEYLTFGYGNTLTIDPSETTTYFVRAQNSCGITSDSLDITVIVKDGPVVDAGVNLDICTGQAQEIQEANVSGQHHVLNWTVEGGYNLLNNNSIINPSLNTNQAWSGKVSLFAMNTTTTCFDTDTIVITINEKPEAKIIADTNLVCFGEEITLLSELPGNWITEDTIYSTFYDIIVEDTTKVFLEIENEGCVGSDSIELIPVYTPNIEISVTTVEEGLKFYFTTDNEELEVLEVIWRMGDGSAYYLDSIVHSYSSNGNYVIELEVVFQGPNCELISIAEMTIDITSTGVEKLSEEKINIYPNPTNGLINFNQEVDRVIVYNILGKQEKIFNNVESINISELSMGMYILEVWINDRPQSIKIQKK